MYKPFYLTKIPASWRETTKERSKLCTQIKKRLKYTFSVTTMNERSTYVL